MTVSVSLSRPGVCCPVGFSAAAAAAALQAGISGMVELPHLDRLARPIAGGYVQELDDGFSRRERVIELLANAVADSLATPVPPGASQQPLPLLVATSEPGRPGGWSERDGGLIDALERRLQIRFHPTLSRVFAEGHVGGPRALAAARALLESRAAGGCLVAGVDSLVSVTTLGWLQDTERLKTDSDSDGLLPGEAAAAVFVEPVLGGSARRRAVSVEGIGFGVEPVHVLSDEPLLGAGICAAASHALAEAGCALHDLDLRLSDLTGEAYGFREQALMMGRLIEQTREALPIWHPAQAIGDCGAAAGACQLAFATHLLAARPERFIRVGLFNSAVGGARSVVVLRAPPAEPAARAKT